MTRTILVGCLLLSLGSLALAADLEKDLQGRWRGSWVIVDVDVRSDCTAAYTNNRLNGRRVAGSGSFPFVAGELAQIDKVDLHRARLDLKLALAEPVRASWQEGPFTLYRHATCRIELEAELPREVVAKKDLAAVERALGQILERYDARPDAEGSKTWNGREVDPFPADYEATLAEHGRWKAEQANAAVQERIVQVEAEAGRVADRIDSDTEYVAGFAQGVERTRALSWPACEAMVVAGIEGFVVHAPSGKRTDAERRHDRGFEDGQRLLVSLELRRRLPGCFLDAP